MTATETLYEFQERLQLRLSPKRPALFTRYGSGKSWIALAYAEYIHRKQWNRSTGSVALILCYKHNIPTWKREIAKRFPQYKVIIDPREMSAEHTPVNGTEHIVIFPYSRMQRGRPAVLWQYVERCRPALLIADESTALKNGRTARARNTIELTRQHQLNRLILTGNPTPESPSEMWSQFQVAFNANPLGASFYIFSRYFLLATDYGFVMRLDREAEFQDIVDKHSVQFTADDWDEYIKTMGQRQLQYTMEFYEPSKEQQETLEYLYRNWSLPECDELDNEYQYEIALLQKAQQISSGFYYRRDRSVHRLKDNPKLVRLIALLKQLFEEWPTRQIVIWQLYEAERPILAEALSEASISYVFGPDEEALGAFDSDSPTRPSVIIMPAMTTQGFNELARADVDIYYSQCYSQEKRDQAEARLDRTGQRSPTVTHIDLCSSSMLDIEIVTALQSKAFTTARAKTIVNKYTGE